MEEGKKPKKCRAGAVRPVATKIVELRVAKGWSQEHLAEKVDLSIRTIQNLESGACCYVVTLRLLAGAFGLPDASPLMPPAEAVPVSQKEKKEELRTEVVVTVNIPPEEFDHSKQLTALASAILILSQAVGTIDVKAVGGGKSQITFDMSMYDAYMLSEGWKTRFRPDSYNQLRRGHKPPPLSKRQKRVRWARSVIQDIQFPNLPKLPDE